MLWTKTERLSIIDGKRSMGGDSAEVGALIRRKSECPGRCRRPTKSPPRAPTPRWRCGVSNGTGTAVAVVGLPGGELGHRFAEVWVAGDLETGGALLDEYAAFDGDDSKVAPEAYARYVETDRRLWDYEAWCAERDMEPVRWRGRYGFNDSDVYVVAPQGGPAHDWPV